MMRGKNNNYYFGSMMVCGDNSCIIVLAIMDGK